MGERSCVCGGHFNFADNEFIHAAGCMLGLGPARISTAGPTPDEQRETNHAYRANVTNLTLARADRGSKPREHRPEDALDLARAWMEECGPENAPQHIVVFLGRTNSDNSSGTKYFQTGSFSSHGQVGLVIEGLDMLRDSGK